MDDSSAGDVGVATALGRICALEAKLRQAIQHTHLLSSSFESDPAAADREREALLAIRSDLYHKSIPVKQAVICLLILLSDTKLLLLLQRTARVVGRQAQRLQVSSRQPV